MCESMTPVYKLCFIYINTHRMKIHYVMNTAHDKRSPSIHFGDTEDQRKIVEKNIKQLNGVSRGLLGLV